MLRTFISKPSSTIQDKSEVYAGYAEFLSDIGHEDKAQMMSDIAEKLRNIN